MLMVAGIYLAVERGRTLRASRVLDDLPNGARVVLAIDVRALDKSASAAILMGAFVDESQLSDIEATCGLDPVRDLSEIVVWIRGSERKPVQSFGAQLEGREASAAILAECHAALVAKRGESVVRVEAPTGPLLASEDRRSALAAIDDRTVVTGSVQTVAEAMAVRRGLLPALSEKERVADIWPIVRRDAALAAIVDLPANWKAAFEGIAPFDEEPSMLETVTTLSLSAKTGVDTTTTLRIDTTSEAAANDWADRVRAWAKMPPAGVATPWVDVLASAAVRVDARAAIVTLDVSALRRAPVPP